MATRNFYIDAYIDDRKTRLTGGPQRKDGGMIVRYMQRDKGERRELFKVHSYTLWDDESTLVTTITDTKTMKVVAEWATER